jgi:hypothetical protein
VSLKAMNWVFEKSPYDGAVYTVHLTMADSVNDDHGMLFFMRQSKLARKARVSRPTVAKAIRKMIEDGLIELVEDNSRNGRDDANRYRFNMPDDMALVYDNKTRSGEPHDAHPESMVARTARDWQEEARRKEHAKANPSLLDQPTDDTPEADAEQDEPMAQVHSLFAADQLDPSPTTDDEPILVEGVLVEDGHDTVRDHDADDAPLTLEQRYEMFPDQPVILDEKQTGKFVQETLGYYIDWRTAQGIGRLKKDDWPRLIGKAVKNLLTKDEVAPRTALDAVLRWHDRNIELINEGKTPMHPGAISGIGATMAEAQAQHGVDGHGTSRRQADEDNRHQAADDILDALADGSLSMPSINTDPDEGHHGELNAG